MVEKAPGKPFAKKGSGQANVMAGIVP